MNYIHHLQHTIKEREAELLAYETMVTEIKVYLTTSKFHEDTTVQVADVLRHLDHAPYHNPPEEPKP